MESRTGAGDSLSARRRRAGDESWHPPASRRVLAFLRRRALPLQIGVAVALAAFFAVAAITGNRGSIGGRAAGVSAPPYVFHPVKYHSFGPYLGYSGASRSPSIWKLDRHGVPVVDYPSIGLRHNAVTTAQYGLWRWGRWRLFHRRSELAAARKQADWLVVHQDPASGKWLFSFPFPTYNLMSHWSSALAQGQAMSLLTRMWRQTNDPVYLRTAERALKPLERPVREGGLVASLDGHPWYEAYPSRPPSFVLSGFMFTLVGLHDLQVGVPHTAAGTRAGHLYREGMRSLAYGLPQFDAGHGQQYYDLRSKGSPHFPRKYASLGYMIVDVQLLQALHSIGSKNPVVRHYLRRWRAAIPPLFKRSAAGSHRHGRHLRKPPAGGLKPGP